MLYTDLDSLSEIADRSKVLNVSTIFCLLQWILQYECNTTKRMVNTSIKNIPPEAKDKPSILFVFGVKSIV